MSNNNQPGNSASSDIWFIYARVDDETFVWIDDYERLNQWRFGTKIPRERVISLLRDSNPPIVYTSYRNGRGYVRGARVRRVKGKNDNYYLRTDADTKKDNNLAELEIVDPNCCEDYLPGIEDHRVITTSTKKLLARYRKSSRRYSYDRRR